MIIFLASWTNHLVIGHKESQEEIHVISEEKYSKTIVKKIA